MWLVLCHAADTAALWAYEGLRLRGLAPLELISAEALAYGARWEHRLGAAGLILDVTLADGRTIRSGCVRGALNRLSTVPNAHLQFAQLADRDYALQELSAFFLSAISALPGPVVNRPTPQGLAGAWRPPSEWAWLAARAGLPVARYEESSSSSLEPSLVVPTTPTRTIVVVNDQPCGPPAPPPILAGCRALARLAEVDLLGVEFVAEASRAWTFAGATPLPDLRLGGAALLDALTLLLRREAS